MSDRNKQGEPICEFSDLPTVMCAHCAGRADEPEPLGVRNQPAKPGRVIPLDTYQHDRAWHRPGQVPMPDHGKTCRCGRPAGDAFVCPTCIDYLEVHLADVPGLVVELDIAAQRRDRVRITPRTPRQPAESARILDGWPGFGDTTDPEMIVTASLVASDAARRWLRILGATRPDKAAAAGALDALGTALVTAVRALLEPLRRTWDGEDTMQAMSLWLLEHSASVGLSPAGPDICADLARAHGRAWSVIDSAPELIDYGPCGICGTRLAVPAGADHVQCLGCGATHMVEQLKQFRRDLAADQLGTTGELAEWTRILGTPVTDRTIRRWAEAGRITPRGSVVCGGVTAPMYRVGDVLDLAKPRQAGA